MIENSRDDTTWVKGQLQELSTRWDTVCKLSVSKQSRLEQALKQVRDFFGDNPRERILADSFAFLYQDQFHPVSNVKPNIDLLNVLQDFNVHSEKKINLVFKDLQMKDDLCGALIGSSVPVTHKGVQAQPFL